MGKVLIATFDDEDEMALDELLLFLKSKKYIRFINTFSNDNYLKYDNLVIDADCQPKRPPVPYSAATL